MTDSCSQRHERVLSTPLASTADSTPRTRVVQPIPGNRNSKPRHPAGAFFVEAEEGTRSMFTLKLYNWNGGRVDIVEVESFTVLRSPNATRIPQVPMALNDGYHALAEITAHLKNGESRRYDIQGHGDPSWPVPSFEKAIIENAAGKTTEIVGYDIPADAENKPVAA